jgi:hypothetical protein
MRYADAPALHPKAGAMRFDLVVAGFAVMLRSDLLGIPGTGVFGAPGSGVIATLGMTREWAPGMTGKGDRETMAMRGSEDGASFVDGRP